MDKCNVIAEIGAVHIGSVERAKDLIRLAILCGADYVKFQKRNPIESVPKNLQNEPHPNVRFSYGDTYLEHRIALELSIDEHKELQEYCKSHKIGYSCSVWDVTSAIEIIGLSPDFIKIPSACNMNDSLLSVLTEEYSGDLHISLGMITREEKQKLYAKYNELGIGERVILYHCTSEYPCPFEHLYLKELDNIKWGPNPKKIIGFSNHGYGIAADVVAYTLGATWIERHFIDDRTFRHTDASASLEPDGLRRLCRDLKAIEKALKTKGDLSSDELAERKKLRPDD